MFEKIKNIFSNSVPEIEIKKADPCFKDVIETIAIEGGRPVGSAGHESAKKYLLNFLEQSGIQPYGEKFELPFNVEDEAFTNLVGIIKGRNSTLPPILIGAHYDTCGAQPGADDNGAAVVINMWLIEKLREAKLQRDVIVAFFDSEEPPYFLSDKMGSKYFHKHQLNHELHAVLVWDLVGHDVPSAGLEDLVFIIGSESHVKWPDIVSKTDLPSGLRMMPSRNKYVGDKSDYHSFREADIPYLFLTCGRWEHYHAVTDTPDRLNYEKIERIAIYSLGLLIEMDRTDFNEKPKLSLNEFEIENTLNIMHALPGYEKLEINLPQELEGFTYQFLKQNQL